MKALLISFLMAVLALQGAVTVLGFAAPSGMQESARQTCAAVAPACDQEQLSDATNVSPAVEELSDYLPAALSAADTYLRLRVMDHPGPPPLSITLPTHTPPPRI